MLHLNIFFADHQVVTLERIEKYTVTDILAIGGGLFGLFLGVSLLSIIEFVYFSTLRLFWNIWRSKNRSSVAPSKRSAASGVSHKSIEFQK